MKKCRWYSALLLGLVLLLAGLVMACGQPEAQPEEESPYTAEELRQIEEQEFFELYQEMKSYIGHAHTSASKLKGFSWHQFGSVGSYRVDKYGVQKWTLFSEILPSADVASPLLAQCDECRALATKVWLERPYEEAQRAVQEMEKLTIPEWRTLCGELELELGEAEHQASNIKAATEELFTAMEDGLSKDRPLIKERYLENFQRKSADYTDLLNEVMYNLKEAEQIASELRSWEFRSLGPAEEAAQPLSAEEAAQPPPTEEAAQVPRTGKQLLYEDDFSDRKSGWPRESADEYDLDYEDGEYHISVKNPHWWSWSLNRLTGLLTDFILEVDARLISGPRESGYGLLFRCQDSENFYLFEVSGDGYYSVDALLDGKWNRLHGKTMSEFIEKDNSTNHLQVVCKGSQMEVYVNGHHLTTITDNSITLGYVGMIVETASLSACVAFDNIRVSSID